MPVSFTQSCVFVGVLGKLTRRGSTDTAADTDNLSAKHSHSHHSLLRDMPDHSNSHGDNTVHAKGEGKNLYTHNTVHAKGEGQSLYTHNTVDTKGEGQSLYTHNTVHTKGEGKRVHTSIFCHHPQL